MSHNLSSKFWLLILLSIKAFFVKLLYGISLNPSTGIKNVVSQTGQAGLGLSWKSFRHFKQNESRQGSVTGSERVKWQIPQPKLHPSDPTFGIPSSVVIFPLVSKHLTFLKKRLNTDENPDIC